MEPTPINTLVSPTLHPDMVLLHAKALEGEDALGAGSLEAAREALAEVYRWHTHVEEADQAFQQVGLAEAGKRGMLKAAVTGGFRTLHGREADIYKAAGEGMVTASKVVDRKLATLNTHAEVLAARVNVATEDPYRKSPQGVALSAEIRAHVKAMSKQDRVSFIQAAIDRGDVQTVAAVLRGPSYLSGIDADIHATLSKSAAVTFAPEADRMLDAVIALRAKVEAAQHTLQTRYHALSKTVGLASKAHDLANAKLKRLGGGQ